MSILNGLTYNCFFCFFCDITDQHREDSSVPCAVMCAEEFNNFKPNSTSNVETETGLVDPNRSLNCSANKRGGYFAVSLFKECMN